MDPLRGALVVGAAWITPIIPKHQLARRPQTCGGERRGGGRRQAGGELVGVEGWCEMQKCLRCWLGSQAPRYIGSAVLLCDIAMAGPLDRALVLR
jgi:hypothetical protein